MIFRSKRAIGKLSRSSSSVRFGASAGKFEFLKRVGLKLMKFSLIFGGAGVLLVALVCLYYSRFLPDIESISTYIPAETTKIYSAEGIILAELHQEENQ